VEQAILIARREEQVDEDKRSEEAREEVPEELRERLDELSEHLVEDGPTDREVDVHDEKGDAPD
jgi:hypothetical protein